MDGVQASRGRSGAPAGTQDAGACLPGAGMLEGVPGFVQVFVLSRRVRGLGRGIGRELKPVQASRVAVSGGARTR